MKSPLGQAIDEIRDGENNPAEFDHAYPVRADLAGSVEALRRRHGDDLCLLPVSGGSCGGGILQTRELASGRPIVGLRFDAPVNPRVSRGAADDPAAVELDEIRIDTEGRRVCAGASITLDQLNRALADELGGGARVAGADLTSYQYAAVGATFMTGGMGPQRRYFSDAVVAASIFDGDRLRTVAGEALTDHAGTYGWSGLVGAVCCRYHRYPANEIAFALPVGDDPEQLGSLLEHLAPWAWLQFDDDGRAASRAADDSLLLGIEHVSAKAMQPLLDSGMGDSIGRARALSEKCAASGAAGLLFVSGLTDRGIDEWLDDLCIESDDGAYSIGGIDLEHAEVFADGEEMRQLREAIPYAARMQSPGGRLLYKNHSDATLRLDPARIAEGFAALWRINRAYVAAVDDHFAASADVDGEILVYGHLNPYGVDPHNRVTLASDDDRAFERSREFLREARADYYRALASLCERGCAEFIGGEKAADSEIAIYAALGGPERAPAALGDRFRGQRERIRAAAPMFNWRALPPYR